MDFSSPFSCFTMSVMEVMISWRMGLAVFERIMNSLRWSICSSTFACRGSSGKGVAGEPQQPGVHTHASSCAARRARVEGLSLHSSKAAQICVVEGEAILRVYIY